MVKQFSKNIAKIDARAVFNRVIEFFSHIVQP